MVKRVGGELFKKWDNLSYEEIKKSAKLQAEYLKDFEIPYFEEGEKIYNPDVQYNQNVLKPEDDDINAFRGTLLSVIWNEKATKNFNKRFYGVNRMGRAILIARMTGYTFQDIAKTSGLKTLEVKKIFLDALQKIINLNREKCKSCQFKQKFDNCRIWKVRVKKDFYCWLYKPRG